MSRSAASFSRRAEAIQCLLGSLAQRPWNWSAWRLLLQCIDRLEDVRPFQVFLQRRSLMWCLQLIVLMPHLTDQLPQLIDNDWPTEVHPILPGGHPALTLFCIWARVEMFSLVLSWDGQGRSL